MSATSAANALAGETSPYLLQHAHNPVRWYPWGEQALHRAAAEHRPILLSIGYSACHWCHVMAHESFEDPVTAEFMNAHFVNIKVDREERPDLDRIYQAAHQLLTRRGGGWPLTMFLTPDDRVPFFGGTYFPPQARHGMPAFRDVLVKIAEAWHQSEADIRHQNTAVLEALRSLEPLPGNTAALDPRPLDEARRALAEAFDERHGGFGGAPKFPHPTNLARLLRHHAATAAAGRPDQAALAMAAFSLARMCEGGIHDHLGGGFCRYAVDDRWMIPHFEKMLYDNGLLLALCAWTWQATGDALFRRRALETGEWVLREMQSPAGGYYSSLDADSEGEEGRYYLWTPDEVRALLAPEEFAALSHRYGLDRAPNFEGRAWHLHGFASVEQTARGLGIEPAEAARRIDAGREKLRAARAARVRPGRDEKTLASWNGLMIKGMAVAGRMLGEARFVASAERALDYVRATLWHGGRLLATARDGRAQLAGYVDDHAFLIDGILALLEARWRAADLAFSCELAELLLAHFEDHDAGGFFFTADDHEALLQRPKPTMDDALPAGNGVAASALARLGHLLGETRYLRAAERALRAAWPSITRVPHAHGALLDALEEHLFPPQVVVLRGTGQDELARWAARCTQAYAPARLTLAIPADAGPLPGLLAERVPLGGGVTAYVCEGHRCHAPVTDYEAFAQVLHGREASPPAVTPP